MADYESHRSAESPHIYQRGSEQYNFVKNDLAQSVVNPEIDWIIALPCTRICSHVGKNTSCSGCVATDISSAIWGI
jgi:hypothetical protein